MRPMVHKGVPWSMDQFKRLFNTVRIPREGKDQLICPFRTGRLQAVNVRKFARVTRQLLYIY